MTKPAVTVRIVRVNLDNENHQSGISNKGGNRLIFIRQIMQ